MCLGVPVQVLHADGHVAWCRDRAGRESRVDLWLVGEQPPGAWLMVFRGAARSVVDADEAARVGDALDALDTLLQGRMPDLDAAFADLVDREPVLPEFLRAAAAQGKEKKQ